MKAGASFREDLDRLWQPPARTRADVELMRNAVGSEMGDQSVGWYSDSLLICRKMVAAGASTYRSQCER